jgi:hypothetical protein
MTSRLHGAVLALAAFASTSPAPANEMRYSFVDFGYSRVDLDDLDDEGSGFFLRGSIAFGERWFVFAGYREAGFDAFGFDVDVEAVQFGAGGHLALTDAVDLVASAGYLERTLDAPFGFAIDESGFLFSPGIRARPFAAVELEAGLEYTNLDDSGGDTGARIAVRYHFAPAFAAGLEFRFGDDETDIGLYGRYTF